MWKADLTTFTADAVVNAANNRLQHTGGLAQDLSKAGGPVIQRECDNYIAQFGTSKTSDVVVTKAGNLPCQKIFHAVGPQLPPNPSAATVRSAKIKLKKAVLNILKTTEIQQCTSFAIPALSSGIFNYPIKQCAEVIVETIKQFHCQQKLDQVLTVNLVSNQASTVTEMERACVKILSQEDTTKMKGSSKRRGKGQALHRDDTSSPPQKKLRRSSSPSTSSPQGQQVLKLK